MFEEITNESALSEKKPTLIRPTFKVATDMVPDWKFFHPSFTFAYQRRQREKKLEETLFRIGTESF